MASTGIAHEQPMVHPAPSTRALQQAPLLAGVLSSLLYVTTDLVAAARYPGYRILDQAISELSAIGSPTERLWSMLAPVYGLLLFAFALGVLRVSHGNRTLRVTGMLLMIFAMSGVLWRFFPMHQRGTELTWQDTGHLILGAGTVILITGFIGTGAFALGRRFRWYSFATIVALVLSGVVVFAWADSVAAGDSTPWLGLVERISIYGYLLWVGVLATALLRRESGLVRSAHSRGAHS